jgi:hypothetical protein
MTDPRCGIANPGPLLLYPPLGFHTASPESVSGLPSGLCSRGVSVEHSDARAIHLPQPPVLCLGPTPP